VLYPLVREAIPVGTPVSLPDLTTPVPVVSFIA
jgi:hypothetical protein